MAEQKKDEKEQPKEQPKAEKGPQDANAKKLVTKSFKATKPGYNGEKVVSKGETFQMKVYEGSKPPSWADEVKEK